MSAPGWAIAAAAIVAILVRPFAINEAWWAAAGAAGLVVAGAIAPRDALLALGRGVDVYLFLAGMMALAECARAAGIFAWAAERMIRIAGRSRWRLFALIYAAGIATTSVLSNDATIVVLTPAVIDALRRSNAPPFAYVVACALVANAASFVLPISNPSNLLVFGGHMPSLGRWLATFALPSLAALVVTFAVLALWFRRELGVAMQAHIPSGVAAPQTLATAVLGGAAVAIVTTSALGGPLGLTAFACAGVSWLVMMIHDRNDARSMVRQIAWPVIALTAALFVIVAAVDAGGGFAATRTAISACSALPAPWSNIALGIVVALASNIANNLPVGLNLGQTLPALHAAPAVTSAALIGVNLGPNATVNGSLATLLWLSIVRRAGISVSALRFAAIGSAATFPALLAALLAIG